MGQAGRGQPFGRFSIPWWDEMCADTPDIAVQRSGGTARTAEETGFKISA